MRRLRLVSVALAAGLIAASAAGTGVAAKTVNPAPEFRASRIHLIGPTNASNPLTVSKDTAILVASVKDWNNQLRAKVTVTFKVLSGPDVNYSESVATNADGNAQMTHGIKDTSRPGTDAVQATYNDGLEIHKSERVFVVWQSGPPARSVVSDARISVSPTCFQPANAVNVTSDQFPSGKPLSSGPIPTPPTTETSAITVSGDEFNPFSAILVTFDAGPGGKPQSFTTKTDGFGHFSTTIQVTEPAEGSHLVRADDFRLREADTTYTVPCFMPSLALDPPIGPPGFVSIAVGTGFPANSTITMLNWGVGIPSPLPTVVRTNADGAFEYPILVLYHDVLGPRLARAVVQNPNGSNAGASIEADAPFLVTPGRTQPPDFVHRR